ncbi:hypothetical protein YC2023_047537 [Brassica napus]
MAFYEIASNLVNYLTARQQEDTISSVRNVNNWSGAFGSRIAGVHRRLIHRPLLDFYCFLSNLRPDGSYIQESLKSYAHKQNMDLLIYDAERQSIAHCTNKNPSLVGRIISWPERCSPPNSGIVGARKINSLSRLTSGRCTVKGSRYGTHFRIENYFFRITIYF